MDDRERKPYIYRLLGLGFVVVLVFSILSYNLWHLQIVRGAEFAAKAQGNVMKTVKVPSTRGDIVDRNGKLLVTSVPQFVLNLDWMDLQQSNSKNWKDVVGRLAGYIQPYWPNPKQSVASITVDILANIQNHQWEQFRPVTILNNVPKPLQASIAEHQEELPGVSVEAIPVRDYPQRTLAGQLLGYVREISDKEIDPFNKNADAKKASFNYALGDLVGKIGVENSYDFWLRGIEGDQQVEVDNSAQPVSKKMINASKPGKTVQLTIDADLQKAVEDSLDESIAVIKKTNPKAGAGAAVVIDVNTGKILAMVSRPAMDPNELTGNFSQAVSDKYFTNNTGPAAAFNRALSAPYPPGSVFKMVTAMAALQFKLTTPNEQIYDDITSLGNKASQDAGFIEYGGNRFGDVNLNKALAKSSDIYFEIMGRRVFEAQPEAIRQIANEFGLGVQSGIDLPTEEKGIAPSTEWRKTYLLPRAQKTRDKDLAAIESDYAPKLANAPDAKAKQTLQTAKVTAINKVQASYQYYVYNYVDWHVSTSYNNAIGQGDNSYTPLQLANYTATIVNGGKHFQPYVVDKLLDPITGKTFQQNQPKVLNSVSVSPDVLDQVKRGMRAVVSVTNSDDAGTAQRIFSDLPDFTGGAKTGTAQKGNVGTELENVYNGMFVAFAPYDHPQIAFAGVVEYGEHGGETAGKVAKAAFMKYFGWKSTNGG